jgi:predicted outer membrane lipoprotein
MIRVFINPRFSPTLILARLIVRNQTPEYVGAAQKKFAWIIGVVLAAAMFFFFIVVNAYSVITGIICLICLIFLFFESAFGICLGCKFYPLFFKDKVQYCPGEVCDVKQKQDIQKTSSGQLIVLLAFITFIVVMVYLMNGRFSEKPHDLFGDEKIEQTIH